MYSLLKVIGDHDLGNVSPHDLGTVSLHNLGTVIGHHYAKCHRRQED
jgi:hypothetical protein